MKTENNYVYMLFFCSSIFSLATAILSQPVSVKGWISIVATWTAVTLAVLLLISDNRQPLPLTDMILLLYIFLLFARVINEMIAYMRVYHRQTQPFAVRIITAVVIMLLSGFGGYKAHKLAVPLTIIVFVMLAAVVLLNINKANPINLYSESGNYSVAVGSITLFDYIIPTSVILNSYGKNDLKKNMTSVFFTGFVIIMLVLYIFSCVKGDLLYSVSPLQIIFQVSEGLHISNFDAYFNYMLWFAYFSAILLLLLRYNCIKNRFQYFSTIDLLFIFPLSAVLKNIDNRFWLPLMAAICIVLKACRKKVGYYEKV